MYMYSGHGYTTNVQDIFYIGRKPLDKGVGIYV